MKIKPEHLETLRAAIEPLDTPERRTKYLAGDFPRAFLVKDLAMRYRWDLLWDAPMTVREPLANTLYEYLNDAHIDTALKAIVDFKAPLTR